MQNCGIIDSGSKRSRDQRAKPRARQFFRKPMKLPSRIDGNVLELAEFLNSTPEPDEISGINDKGDPGIMKFRNGGYFRRPTAAAGCRIFIEDGAKLRVVRVSNMQSGWWPFSSATIDVNYRDIVVPSFTPPPPFLP